MLSSSARIFSPSAGEASVRDSMERFSASEASCAMSSATTRQRSTAMAGRSSSIGPSAWCVGLSGTSAIESFSSSPLAGIRIAVQTMLKSECATAMVAAVAGRDKNAG